MCELYGRAAAVVGSPYLQLLPSFSVPGLLAASADSDQAPFCCYTIICICCQASLSLLTIAALADEAAAQICSCWSAAAWLLIAAQCTGAATAAADVAAADLAFQFLLLGLRTAAAS